MCVIISTNCIINYFTTFFRWHFTFENITNYFIFINIKDYIITYYITKFIPHIINSILLYNLVVVFSPFVVTVYTLKKSRF